MATTHNFNDFIDNLDDTDVEDMYNLYESVQHITQMGDFNTITNANGQKIVICLPTDERLILVTPQAESTFLDVLDYQFGGDFKSVALHWDFVRAMRKDD